MYDAIAREKRLKKWKRQWKLELIEAHNPFWQDLLSADGTILALPKD
jgi:putative endonuclease